ncbi:hypothetical protein MJM59_33725, partial [Salmonella enterica subsp. enterica serovar Montevideo]|nr:hypothetical protein [Salmonella enterica subsp. enterica serovar Montevideo]
ALFGIKPAWFSDPNTARAMVIIVNTWLGYPYMMILCMGLLKANNNDIKSVKDLDGKVVAVKSGTGSVDYAKANIKTKDLRQ